MLVPFKACKPKGNNLRFKLGAAHEAELHNTEEQMIVK